MKGRDSKGRFVKGHKLWVGSRYFGKGHIVSDIERKRMSISAKRRPCNRKGAHQSEDTKEKCRKATIRRLELHPEDHPNRVLARNYHVSKPQLKLFRIIKAWYYSDAELELYVKTKDFGGKGSQGRFCDIGVLSEKLDIEYDGKEWHQDPMVDFARDVEMQNAGWEVIRIGGLCIER